MIDQKEQLERDIIHKAAPKPDNKSYMASVSESII